MFCPHCGTQLEEDGNFCPFCGGPLNEEEDFSDHTQYTSEPMEGPADAPIQNQWLVGRSKSCDFVIPSGRVSRQHCRIFLTPDGFFVIEDLSSTNGTFLNGTPLQAPAQLYPGDQITFADMSLTFEIDRGMPVLY